MDYLDYYNREAYLFEVVGPRFRRGYGLSAFDFFTIVAWKAERAKSRVASRVKRISGVRNLDRGVKKLSKAIRGGGDKAARLEIVNVDWGFRLPMATAILSVLYPDDFTVFDVRVCDELDFPASAADRAWPRRAVEYWRYVEAVRAAAPKVRLNRSRFLGQVGRLIRLPCA